MLDLQATNHRRRLLINFQLRLPQQSENFELVQESRLLLFRASKTVRYWPVAPPPVMCPESYASGLPTRTLPGLLPRPTA